MTTPRASIIVPVYNVETEVAAALSSARAQTESRIEIIVIDDGSTDQSGEIAEKIAANDPRIRVIRQTNLGLGAARNIGLAEATGDWIAFLDGDDALEPDFLERLLIAAEATKCDWVAGGVTFVMGQTTAYRGPLSGDGQMTEPSGKGEIVNLADWSRISNVLVSTWNKIYRRDLLDGLRFEEDLWYEDQNFLIAVADRADRIACLDVPLYRHTRHRDGQITGADDNRVFDQFTVLENAEMLLRASAKPGAEQVFDGAASRLVGERLYPLRNRVRRKAFVDAAREFFDAPHRKFDRSVSETAQILSSVLDGRLPITIIIPSNGAKIPLAATLTSLEDQSFREIEVIVVFDGDAPDLTSDVFDLKVLEQSDKGPGAARNVGLGAARGDYVLFLDAGDQVEHWGLQHVVATALKEDADMVTTGFSLGQRDAYCPGRYDRVEAPKIGSAYRPTGAQILDIHMHPSTKIFKRSLLERSGAKFGVSALSAWPIVLTSALAADRIAYLDPPFVFVDEGAGCRDIWRKPVSVAALRAVLKDLERIGATDTRLEAGWLGVFAARAIWESAIWAEFPSKTKRRIYRRWAIWRLRDYLRGSLPFDPFIPAKSR